MVGVVVELDGAFRLGDKDEGDGVVGSGDGDDGGGGDGC